MAHNGYSGLPSLPSADGSASRTARPPRRPSNASTSSAPASPTWTYHQAIKRSVDHHAFNTATPVRLTSLPREDTPRAGPSSSRQGSYSSPVSPPPLSPFTRQLEETSGENDAVSELRVGSATSSERVVVTRPAKNGRRTRPVSEEEVLELDFQDAKPPLVTPISATRLPHSPSMSAVSGKTVSQVVMDEYAEGSSSSKTSLGQHHHYSRQVSNGTSVVALEPAKDAEGAGNESPFDSTASSPQLRHMASITSNRTIADKSESTSSQSHSHHPSPAPQPGPQLASPLTTSPSSMAPATTPLISQFTTNMTPSSSTQTTSSPSAFFNQFRSRSTTAPSATSTKTTPAPRSQGGHSSRKTSQQNHSSSLREALRDGDRRVTKDAWRRVTSSRGPDLPHASVDPSSAACMYWSKASTHGHKVPPAMRAHSASLVNDEIWIFGGTDSNGCFKDVWRLDVETLAWSRPKCGGDVPPSMRAHTATAVDGRIFVFGGGDGLSYNNDLYYLDTVSQHWYKPNVGGTLPPIRRAHAAVLYGQQIIIFGGGNGTKALKDVHALDVSNLDHLEWRQLVVKGKPPHQRGYHTATLVGSKAVILGGSDGGECFRDIHVLDLENLKWTALKLEQRIPRLAHTATQVGSYLFVIGGHDSIEYTSDVLLFNLVALQWEPRVVKGMPPPPIGYHTTILHDSRLIVIGGFDGQHVHEGVWCLDLASCAYLPQVTNFDIPTD